MRRCIMCFVGLFLMFAVRGQIMPVNTIDELDFGGLTSFLTYKRYNDDLIIGGIVRGGNSGSPFMARLTKGGEVIWNTLEHTNLPFIGSYDIRMKSTLSKDGHIYCIMIPSSFSNYDPVLFKVDVNTGEVVNIQSYGEIDFKFSRVLEIGDKLVASRVVGDVSTLSFIDKESLHVYDEYVFSNYDRLAVLGADHSNNIFVALGDTIRKHNFLNIDLTLWETKLDYSDRIDRIHFSNEGELFVFHRGHTLSGLVSKMNSFTGEVLSRGITVEDQSFLRKVIEDDSFLYPIYGHLYVGAGTSYFSTAKIRKEDGAVIWKGEFDVSLSSEDEVYSGKRASAISITLDCNSDLYMTGYFDSSNYGPGKCGVVKVSGEDGTKMWDQIITTNTGVDEMVSIGYGVELINDTLVVLAELQSDDTVTMYVSQIDQNTGEILELDKVFVESCRFAGISDLFVYEDECIDVGYNSLDVISHSYKTFDVEEVNSFRRSAGRLESGLVFKNDYLHVFSSIWYDKYSNRSEIIVRTRVNSDELHEEIISMNSIDVQVLDIFGGNNFVSLLYRVDNEIRCRTIRYYIDVVTDVFIEQVDGSPQESLRKNVLGRYGNNPLFYIGKEQVDFYKIPEMTISASLPYVSKMNATSYAMLNDSILCMVGEFLTGEIGVNMLDLSTGEEYWSIELHNYNYISDIVYDGADGLYVTGRDGEGMKVTRLNRYTGEVVWDFANSDLLANVIANDLAIIPQRNTIAVACTKVNTLNSSDGQLLILDLQGNVVHVEEYVDELNALSSVRSVEAGADLLYYFGGSHNTLAKGKRGFVNTADVSAINNGIGLNGVVYYDSNQNGVRDFEEHGIPNVKVQIEPINGYTLTDSNGEYLQLAESGESYNIQSLIDTSVFMLTTDTASYNVGYTEGSHRNYDFGYYSDLDHRVLLNITSNPTRCNEESRFYVQIQNLGDKLEDVSFKFKYDVKTSYLDSYIEPVSVNEGMNEIVWTFERINPFETITFNIDLLMPSDMFTGHLIEFNGFVEVGGDLLQQYEYSPIVLCSYDPNDKIVMPIGHYEENYTLFGDSLLTYTVRFQNTGNAPAKNVVIRDTIDLNIDMSTFQVINSSHSLRTNIDENRVEFVFNDIYLVDSLSNEPESHGQVTYSVKLKEEVFSNTLIENSASIYFDFNPPIVTNTTQNLMVDMLPTATVDLEKLDLFRVYPNPGFDVLFIEQLGEHRVKKVKLFSLEGVLLGDYNSSEIDIRDLVSGSYMLQIISGMEIMIVKFVKS